MFLSYGVRCVHAQDWDCWVIGILIFVFNFICLLFLFVLGLCCCMDFSLVVVSGGFFLVALHGLLIVVASLVAEHSSKAC